MNLLTRINQFFLLFVDTLRQFGRWRIWLLLLGYFLLHWLVLYSHYKFPVPPFYGLLAPWIRLVGGDQAVAFGHYPQHLFYLGSYYGWAKIMVGLVLEGAVLGAVANLFHQAYARQVSPGSQHYWFWLWGNLVPAWIVLNAGMLAVGTILPDLAGPYLSGPRRVLAFSYVFLPGVFAFVFALFFFAIPRVATLGENAAVAIFRSLTTFFRRPFTCFFLALSILIVPALLNAVISRPASIIDRFRPELIYWLLTISLAIEIVANFFWIGTAVRYLFEPEE